jgi:CHAT domain-containing protein/tetratricopeptide (TPR) repeat protein
MRTWRVVLLYLYVLSFSVGALAQRAPSPDEPGELLSRALQLYASGNCEASLPLSRKAEELLRTRGLALTADFATALVAQGLCHKRHQRVAEAERAYRQAIDILEKVQGPNGRDLAIALDNLGSLYQEHRRFAESEQLRLRALDIFRATLDPASPHIVTTLQNLGALYLMQDRLPKAQGMLELALGAAEKAYGPDSRQVGVVADNLAGVYRSQQRFDQAEAMYLKAIANFEKSLGGDHPDTALALQNYAIQLSETGRLQDAEARLKQALAINERLYGPNHGAISSALNTLVLQQISQQRWRDALDSARRGAAVAVQLAGLGQAGASSAGGPGTTAFRRLAQAAYALDPVDPALMDEAYIAAQRALSTSASTALSQMAVRHAAGSGALAALAREREDLIQEHESGDRLLIASVARPPSQRDRQGEAALRARLEGIGRRIDAIGQELGKRFPEYAALSRPEPLSIAATQALLQPGEALLQFLDLPAEAAIPETGFAWLITKTEAEWVRLPIGSNALARSVAALRCGLDATQWLADGSKTCRELLGRDPPARGRPLPFNLEIAHKLYKSLLGGVEAKIKDKHLLIVTAGALTTVPLSILVTEPPAQAVPETPAGYRGAAWLGLRQPVTILPSVASLKGLRALAKGSHATRPYLGIGNPLLNGEQNSAEYGTFFRQRAETARLKQKCSRTEVAKAVSTTVVRTAAPFDRLFRGRNADVDTLRELAPLPETAEELCEIARRLGVPDSEVLLGARATESTLKQFSEQGRLADYGILHFATHGALAGELSGNAEPGLVLTPPARDPSGGADALDRDDGFLTASEIATLRLDADWVILSACNTAGGSGDTAEALSGMARAFFYAGARALLVSHWEVDSRAAVKLTTRAFDALRSSPTLSRADAFRLSMRELAETGEPGDAHPARWAPFVVVGDGTATVQAAPERAAAPPSRRVSPGPEPVAPARKPNAPAADWRTDVWRQ